MPEMCWVREDSPTVWGKCHEVTKRDGRVRAEAPGAGLRGEKPRHGRKGWKRMEYSLPFLLDGASGTLAAEMGFRAGECLEAWFCEHPQAVREIVRGYLEAGAQAVYAPTFGANRAALARYGLESRVRELNRRIVALAREAAEPYSAPVGASVCPTGMLVPPHGDGDFDEIYSVYREQIRAVEEAGVDFVAVETQGSLADVRAAVLAARTTDLPVLATMTVDDNGKTVTGGSLLPAVITLQAMGVDAVGLGCCSGPDGMAEILAETLPHASVPLIAKPSAGLPGHTLSPEGFAQAMREVLSAGAGIVGGCCGTTPEHIRALCRVMREFDFPAGRHAYEDADCYAAATETEAFFLGDNIVLSEPIKCSVRLVDDLIDLNDEQVNAALVELETLDDVEILCRSALASSLPVAVRTQDRMILDAALRYFQGRLIVDSNCDIDYQLIERTAAKYGAIVY